MIKRIIYKLFKRNNIDFTWKDKSGNNNHLKSNSIVSTPVFNNKSVNICN